MFETLILASPSATGGAGWNAAYGPELSSALIIVYGFMLPIVLLRRRVKKSVPGGLIRGADNRISTSKAIAVAWTFVVAWMVVAEAFVAVFPGNSSVAFPRLLASASDLYFVLLGGPMAAAVFAKAWTQSRIAQGTLTKTTGTPHVFDLICDDDGNADLYDFQYVLFNIIALLIVAISFAVNPDKGLPAVPAFLAILTAGSALTYSAGKAVAVGLSAGKPTPDE